MRISGFCKRCGSYERMEKNESNNCKFCGGIGTVVDTEISLFDFSDNREEYRDRFIYKYKEEGLYDEQLAQRVAEERQARVAAISAGAHAMSAGNGRLTCPSCGGRVTKISMGSKLFSTGIFGAASRSVGKNYKCTRCGYMF